MSPLRLSLLAVVAAALAAPAAAGAAGWSRPAVLGASGGTLSEPMMQADLTSHGLSVVVWTRGADVLAASGAPNGTFGAPRVLGRGHDPSVAVAADGSAVATWIRGHRVLAAARDRFGHFGRPFEVARVASPSDLVNAQVATNAAGDAVIAWERFCTKRGCTSAVQARTRSATGTLGPAQTLESWGGYGFMDRGALTVAADGTFALGWTSAARATAPSTPKAALRRPGAAGFAVSTLASTQSSESVVRLSPTGAAVAGWIGGVRDESRFAAPVQAALGAPAGGFGAPVAGPANRAFDLAGAWGAGGAVLAWLDRVHDTRPSLHNGPLRASTLSAGGTFSAPQTLDASARTRDPHLRAVGGDVLALWVGGPAHGALRWHTALARSGAAFHPLRAPSGTPERLFSSAADSVATAGRHVLVVWQQSGRVRASTRAL